MAKARIAIVGAGGFAREVRWLISEINKLRDRFEFAGYVVSDVNRIGEHDSADEIVGDMSWLEANRGKIDALAMGIGAPKARIKVGDELEASFPDIDWPALVHPSVIMDFDSATVGRGTLLCAGVVGTVNLVIEPLCLVNLLCTLGHEAHLGRGSVLNPTVNISGGVNIGAGALIGTGAQILQYVNVGNGAQVGAGAVVTKHVPDEETVVGSPAMPLGDFSLQRKALKKLAATPSVEKPTD